MPVIKLLNYFIVIGKLFLWDSRRSQTLPKIQGLQSKLKIKYETEKNINKKNYFEKKWVLTPIIKYAHLILSPFSFNMNVSFIMLLTALI